MAAPLIAVINHEPIFLRLMEGLLKSEGYDCMTIQDGGLAFEVVARESPALIILDTWLSSRDQGLDLIQVLRLDERTASIPVLVLSSDDKQTVTERLMSPGKDGLQLLFKPFEPDELLSTVRVMLDGHGLDGDGP